MSDPTRIVEFSGAVVITGGSGGEMRFLKQDLIKRKGLPRGGFDSEFSKTPPAAPTFQN